MADNEQLDVVQTIANLNSMGATFNVGSAQHGDWKGWQVDISFAPKTGGLGKPSNLAELLTGQAGEDAEAHTDPENPDHNHVIQIRVWDQDYEAAVRRCAKAFFAAYTASISEVGLIDLPTE